MTIYISDYSTGDILIQAKKHTFRQKNKVETESDDFTIELTLSTDCFPTKFSFFSESLIMFPHIVKLMILVTDPIGSPLLLLGSERAKSLYVDLLLLPADKPGWIYFFERFSGVKKAALEKIVPECDIFFFSLKSIKWAGRWGAAI